MSMSKNTNKYNYVFVCLSLYLYLYLYIYIQFYLFICICICVYRLMHMSLTWVDIASQPMKPNEPYPSISKFTSSELRPICAICREIVMLSSVVSDWFHPQLGSFSSEQSHFFSPFGTFCHGGIRVTIWALAKTDRFGHSFVLTIHFRGSQLWPTANKKLSHPWSPLEALAFPLHHAAHSACGQRCQDRRCRERWSHSSVQRTVDLMCKEASEDVHFRLCLHIMRATQ